MRCPHCNYRNPSGFKYCGNCGNPLESAPVQEKRWATILFYDVSGFSTYAHEHDLEETHRALNYLLRHCRNCVNNNGGHVDKLYGDGLLAVFGFRDSSRDEPKKALRAAVCMVRKIESGALRGRAGIATGMVMLGPLGGESYAHQTVIGEAVNLAQRMVSAAPAGSIWLDETTSRLIPEARLRELEPMHFKGFREPRRVWEFKDWGGRPEPLFGRTFELQKILDFLDQDRGGLLVVAGPLGIGKTFLVDEALRRRAGRLRPIIIPELNVSDPVRPRLRAAFTSNFGPDPLDYLDDLGLGELDKRLLSYALGLERDRPAPLSELENALVATMRRTLSLLAREKPVALIAHSGPRDHTLVRAMMKSLKESPLPRVSVIVLRRHPVDGADIRLGPLPPRDADDYLRHINPSLDADQRRKIYEEAQGNPLGMRLLALNDDPTTTIMAAFQSRLDKLPSLHRRVLLYAALGRPATWPGVLKELLGEDSLDAVRHLIKDGYLSGASGPLDERSRLEVSNPLLQQAAYSLLPANERRLVHRTYWKWLISQRERRLAAVAAEHARLAGLGEESALAWIKAGDYQLEAGIFSGAERSYSKALLTASGKSRQQALEKLAEMHLTAGSAAKAWELLQGEEGEWAERLKGMALAALEQPDRARPLLKAALARNPNDVHVELALINLEPAEKRLEKLQVLKERLDADSRSNDAVKPFVNLRLAETLAAGFKLKEAVAVMRDAYQGFVDISNGSRAAEAALAISGYMWHSERLAAAAEWADRAIEHGRKAHPGVATIAWSVRGGLWLDEGRPDEAENALRQAEVNVEHARNEHERARIYAIRMRFYIETGQLAQAIELGERIMAASPHPWLAANLALAHALKGGQHSEERLQQLSAGYMDLAPPPGKSVFLLAHALRSWRNGENPGPFLKKSLKQGRGSGPYLRYLTLVLWGIYHLDNSPVKARALAHYLQQRSSSGGFRVVNQTARLLMGELALAAGEPVAHLLRFEPSLGPQKSWRRSLMARAGLDVQAAAPPSLSGYGILGAWARLSWREAVRAKENGST